MPLVSRKLQDSPVGILSAVAGLLVAAERCMRIPVGIVDVDRSGAQFRRHVPRVLQVCRRHVGGKSINRVVGVVDRLLFGFIRQDGEHGTEDLLARYRHLVPHVAEYGGFDVVTGFETLRPAYAADYQRGAFIDARLDEPLNLIELHLAHDRTQDLVSAALAEHRRGGRPQRLPSQSPTLRRADSRARTFALARHKTDRCC